VERLWERYEPFADKNFRSAAAHDFDRRYWEMEVASVLLQQGFQLVPRRERPAEGPDLLVREPSGRVWIEVTAPGPGRGPDAVPLHELGKARYVPEEQITLRFCNALCEKLGLLKKWVDHGIVQAEDAFVIALNGAGVPDAWPDSYPPRIARAVFPFGSWYVSIDRMSLEVVGQGITYQPSIQKQNRASVSTTLFLEAESAGISAILYSAQVLRSRTPEQISPDAELGGDLLLLHNPHARNRLPLGWLGIGVDYWLDEGAELKHAPSRR
jgi:hypothetical protein